MKKKFTLQCSNCFLYFSSGKDLDAHRYGPVDNVRCMTSVQMTQEGWKLNRNNDGWYLPKVRL